jgi:CRP/FNR family transcriptional regulator, cyclic AMP receptor protein
MEVDPWTGDSEARDVRMLQPARLQQVPFLASLPEAQLRELLHSCQQRRFPRGTVLFHQDDPGNALYFLQAGWVKIVRLAPTGEERILNVLGPGIAFGEMALVDGAPRSAAAIALDPVEALVLYREPFLALIQGSPAVALAVMSGLAGMVRQLSEQIAYLTSLDVPGRLAKTLLELAARYGEETPTGRRIALPLTQRELAEMIGAARAPVNQSLQGFQKQGILTVERQAILLHQPEQLQKRIY